MQIIKRDGTKVDFDKQRIKNAILMSMKYGSGIVKEKIAEKIANECEEFFLEGNKVPTVHMVEDYVYNSLIKHKHKETAKAYEGYRAIQEYKRNTHPIDEQILNLIENKDEFLSKENANKDSKLASTQRDLMAGAISRYESLTKKIPSYLVQAHNEGIIKIHDLDYFINPITNCELIPLDTMFEKGTVINKKLIETPKSLRTATTLATQIIAQVTSYTYGGCSISLSHIAPYVRVSKNRHIQEVQEEGISIGITYSQEQIEAIANMRLKKEIKDSIQTLNYQISTINSTNGQSPFVTIFVYLQENPEYTEELAMLAKELFEQRIVGMKNEYGVVSTQTFPKMLFVLDEDNIHICSKYHWLLQLAIKSTSKRMSPDYISAKKMKELYGEVFPCMGCRSFLFPFEVNGKFKWYGRMNLGVTTINLPDVALSSKGDIKEFWNILDSRLENLVKPSLEMRYHKLEGVTADVAPILWQHGVFARLKPKQLITEALDKVGYSLSIGYTGLYETVYYLIKHSHTSEDGFKLGTEIQKYLDDKATKWREDTGMGFSVYGTPQEESTDWFAKKLKIRFGEIENITDKGYITNSYHVDIREPIDAFSKLEIEGQYQKYSKGGNVSYIETPNLENNLEVIYEVLKCMYENNTHAEINTESDTCGNCGYQGVMDNDDKTLEWICPNCGCRDQSKLSVVRRVCGYLSDKGQYAFGRMMDILNRVKHL